MVRALFLLIASVVLAAVASGDQVTDKPGDKEVATDPVLRGSTEVMNKNVGDNALFTLEAEEANSAPADVRLTEEKEELHPPAGQEHYGGFYGYRRRFYYPYGGGYHYGWRYPLYYWNQYSPYYGDCGYGVPYGGYYYC
uniref:RxLR effector protein n=1 Tax=Globisporangium ultimum (strain ATCC 200006 / CBS 805.95 / DAOM BR144) TaxID=431595 RepID=K3WGP1_GLOUD